MTTTLIRYILYLLLINSVVSAEKIDISFEVFHAKKTYMDIAKQKLNRLDNEGLSCYIVKLKDEEISLRCNDAHTLQEMQKNINILQKKGISFSIINKKELQKQKKRKYTKKSSVENSLQNGYRAYNAKEYARAEQIFANLYRKKSTFENAYAYSLALMQMHKYERALHILQNYREPKARSLYDDIVQSYYYRALESGNYATAYKIAMKYHLPREKQLEIPYMQAVALFQKKEYEKAEKIIAPYRKESKKINKLYNDILYGKAIDKGWSLVKSDPSKAIEEFKAACKIKKDFDCYNGMMYGYYNLKKYKVSRYLAEKLYAYKADQKVAEMAFDSNMALKDYKGAQKWYALLKDKNGVRNPYLDEYFVTIDKDIKEKKYAEAERLVQIVLQYYPNNSRALKRQMRLYVAEKKYLKAQRVAEEILQKNPKDSDAKYVLALKAFEEKNYKECISVLEDENLTQSYQKDMRYRCEAYDRWSDGNLSSAQASIENVKNKQIIYAFYLDLANYYDKKDDERAVTAYKKAQAYAGNSIDNELSYLFALKKFHKDLQLESELKSAYAKFPTESKKLDDFKHMYEKERLFNLYKDKKYKACYDYSKTIDSNHKDVDIYTMAGWCAYSTGNYAAAKVSFSRANALSSQSKKDLYAYALISSKLNDRNSTVNALKQIKMFKDDKERLHVVNLYAAVQDQEQAKTLLPTISDPKVQKAAWKSINKSYTDLIYENSISAGFYLQSQDGEKGLTSFSKYVLPIDYDYYSLQKRIHFYIDSDILHLYNGKLDSLASFEDYGFGTTQQENTLEYDIGFMPKVGLDVKQYHFMIGTTPLGSKISPELTALLSAYFTKNRWMATIKLEQKELDETMLSFVGERAKDDTQEVYWGRVVKRAATFGISYDAPVNLSLNILYAPEIFGENVETNSEMKAIFTAIYYPVVQDLDYMQIGAIAIYDSYDKNENLFTYGHGGYFSPQSFLMTGVFTEFGEHLDEDLYYKAKLALGFETYSVDDTKKFPLNDGVVDSDAIVEGYNAQGIDYKVALQVGYRINRDLDFISGFSFEKFEDYTTHEFTLAFVYRFGDHFNDYNTFYLNHRVDSIIPRYEVAK